MSLKKRVQPYVAHFLTSDRLLQHKRGKFERHRQRRKQAHQLEVFLSFNDPYSALLVQILKTLPQRFKVELLIRIVLERDPEMFPDEVRLEAWSVRDCCYWAECYGLWAPVRTQHNQDELKTVSQTAAGINDLEQISDLFQAYWQGLDYAVSKNTDHPLKDNEQRLRTQGHYLPASIYYGGEWYWGLDRINHLETRLAELGLAINPNESSPHEKRLERLIGEYPKELVKQPLEIFWSARSPYSYLALEQCVELGQHYDLEIKIHPILPMVMRNFKVPKTKRLYILGDSRREAKLMGLPFGRVCDPLGIATERCYAVMAQLKESGKDVPFALSFARSSWSQGIDGASRRGLNMIGEQAGISWSEIEKALADEHWRQAVEQNRETLFDLGFWGVPVIRYGRTVVWGQDRLRPIEQAILGQQTGLEV